MIGRVDPPAMPPTGSPGMNSGDALHDRPATDRETGSAIGNFFTNQAMIVPAIALNYNALGYRPWVYNDSLRKKRAEESH